MSELGPPSLYTHIVAHAKTMKNDNVVLSFVRYFTSGNHEPFFFFGVSDVRDVSPDVSCNFIHTSCGSCKNNEK